MAVLIVVVALATGEAPPSTLPIDDVEFSIGTVAEAAFWTALFAIPISISVWALLDVARRPRWAWAMSRHRQVVWLAAILAGVLSVLGGLLISGWYLMRVRPVIAAAERGEWDAGA